MQGWAACERENADQAPHTYPPVNGRTGPYFGNASRTWASRSGVFASLVPRATTAAPWKLKLTPSHNLTLLITHRSQSKESHTLSKIHFREFRRTTPLKAAAQHHTHHAS